MALPKSSPGDEYTIDDKDRNQIQPSESYQRNLHRYQLYQNLMLGGERMLLPPTGTQHPITGGVLFTGSYLRRLPGESKVQKGDATGNTDAWEARRDVGAHDPIAAQIVWTYVDTFFRQQVDRSAVEKELGEDILGNVDLKGTDADDFIAWSYAQGLSQGWMVGLIDMPASDEVLPSAMHEADKGIRPYLQIITPLRVWDIEENEYGEVVYALIRESRNRWRAWYPGYTEIRNEKDEVVSSETNPYGRVPMVVFRANDADPDDPQAPLGESAMAVTGLLDVQILNHLSLLDDVQRKTGFPFLHLGTDPDTSQQPNGDTTLGTSFILELPGVAEWIAPPPSCPQESRDHIDWLESMAMKIGGVHRRSQESVEAHSGLAIDWENAPIYATVHRWASRLRVWETKVWRMMADMMGKDPSAIAVIYPEDFSSRPADQDLKHADAIMKLYGGNPPDWVQAGVDALVRRVLERLIGHLPDIRSAIPDTLPTDQADAAIPLSGAPDPMGSTPTVSELDAEAVDPQTALNGAQVSALLEVVQSVVDGQLPRESAVFIISSSFPVSEADAERILGDVGRGFVPEEENDNAPTEGAEDEGNEEDE